jgi:hypothetical protein
MVKCIQTWECEICGQVYGRLNDAIKCEAKGVQGTKPIKGLVAHYDKDMLVVAIEPFVHHHKVHWKCYYFRDRYDRGDTTDFKCPAQEQDAIIAWASEKVNKEMPAFGRIKKFFAGKNISTWTFQDSIIKKKKNKP